MLQIAYEPLDALKPYSRNPRTHSSAQIKQIEQSLEHFGWCTPIGKADGILIYGHARLQAAINLRKKGKAIPGNADANFAPVVDLSYLSEEDRKAYVIADNQHALNAGWDEKLLKLEMGDLANLGGFDLSLTGFSAKELTSLLRPDTEQRGELLDLMNITIGEPRHKVEEGDHWKMERHHLLCVSVIEDHVIWRPLLVPGTAFVPYPGPFVAFGANIGDRVLVMVQPDPYAAGHVLDRFEDAHGAGSTGKVSSRAS